MQTTIALVAILVIGLFSCSSPADDKNAPVIEATSQQQDAATKMPALDLIDANGKTVNLSSFKGKKVFVNLWATWCPPCRAEIPSIELLATKVDKEKAVFILLSLDDNFEVAKKFAKTENLKVPIYYPAENLPALFNTGGIPVTFIFNENGDLVKQNNGVDDYNTEEYIRLLSAK